MQDELDKVPPATDACAKSESSSQAFGARLWRLIMKGRAPREARGLTSFEAVLTASLLHGGFNG